MKKIILIVFMLLVSTAGFGAKDDEGHWYIGANMGYTPNVMSAVMPLYQFGSNRKDSIISTLYVGYLFGVKEKLKIGPEISYTLPSNVGMNSFKEISYDVSQRTTFDAKIYSINSLLTMNYSISDAVSFFLKGGIAIKNYSINDTTTSARVIEKTKEIELDQARYSKSMTKITPVVNFGTLISVMPNLDLSIGIQWNGLSQTMNYITPSMKFGEPNKASVSFNDSLAWLVGLQYSF